jgi:hypothetical protein
MFAILANFVESRGLMNLDIGFLTDHLLALYLTYQSYRLSIVALIKLILDWKIYMKIDLKGSQVAVVSQVLWNSEHWCAKSMSNLVVLLCYLLKDQIVTHTGQHRKVQFKMLRKEFFRWRISVYTLSLSLSLLSKCLILQGGVSLQSKRMTCIVVYTCILEVAL